MKQLNISVLVKVYQESELTADELALVNAAKAATANSYARYSNFNVGAAVRLKNGRVLIGANQENAAFPSGLCAERTAIFSAQANFPDQPIVALAIAAKNARGFLRAPVTPCGACRQVILEIEDRYATPVRILLYGTDGIYCVESVKDLLPLSFVDANMHA